MRRNLFLFLLVAVGSAWVVAWSLTPFASLRIFRARSPQDVDENAALPEVSVPMLGPVRKIKGLGDPAKLVRQPRVNSDMLEPHRLAIRLPDGRTIRFAARSMSILGDRGIVQDFYVRRPLNCAPFKEAVADLKRTMKELGIEPGAIMKRHMAEWGDEFPGYGEGKGTPYKLSTATHAFPGVNLGIQVTPHPDGGWFYLMIIGVESEERAAGEALVNITNFTDELGKPVPKARLAETAPGHEFPDVSLTLPGTSRQVRGFDPGEPIPTASLRHPNLFQPHRLTIRLPGDRTMALDARAMTLLYDDKVIYGVHVRRPMDPVPFGEAVADLRRTLEGMGITPDGAMARQMAAWPGDAPGFDRTDDPEEFSASMALSDAARLDVRVLPDPKGRWFSLISLTIDPGGRRVPPAIEAAKPPNPGRPS